MNIHLLRSMTERLKGNGCERDKSLATNLESNSADEERLHASRPSSKIRKSRAPTSQERSNCLRFDNFACELPEGLVMEVDRSKWIRR